jgi:hypothetical protein
MTQTQGNDVPKSRKISNYRCLKIASPREELEQYAEKVEREIWSDDTSSEIDLVSRS